MAMRAVIVNGRASPDGTALLDVDDPGLTLGLSVFETLRTYGRTPFRLERHLERLLASAAACGVPWPGEAILAEEVRQVIAEIPGESNVRVTLTAGGARLVRAMPLEVASGGARCATAVFEPPPWLPGAVKHTSRAGSALIVPRSGVSEVIWLDREGCLLEGTRSNVLAVREGVIWTPPLDGRILAGVTREALLEVARSLGIRVQEAPCPAKGPWDELYLCSTLRELQPIVALDGQPAAGEGPVGAALLAGFRGAVAQAS